MGFESTLGWKLLYREELREEPVIDAHRYTAVVAIHVHIIVTHHGQSFKAPLAYQTCTREASAAQRLRSNGQSGSYSGPEVGFEEIAIDLRQARFWTMRQWEIR
jgi:hypothetical protein